MKKLALLYLLLSMPITSVYSMFHKTAVSLIRSSKKHDSVADLLKKLIEQRKEHNDMVADVLKKLIAQKQEYNQTMLKLLQKELPWICFHLWMVWAVILTKNYKH